VAAIALALVAPTTIPAQAPTPETQLRQTVKAFYAAFNSHRFDRAADFTTDDWNHINPPLGGRWLIMQDHNTILTPLATATR
jgi:hypothetical protein